MFKNIQNAQAPASGELYDSFGDKNNRAAVPWLYYAQRRSEIRKNPIDLTVRFTEPLPGEDRGNQFLTYHVARYNLQGEFQGMEELKTQLSICSINYQEVINMKRFGLVTDNSCTYELSQLVGGASEVPKGVNSFYELYIEDEQGNLVDVPVLVTNFRDADGKMPNAAGFTDGARLVHRFFVSETVSGIEARGGFNEGHKVPTYIRYASSIKLRVERDPAVNEAIFKPVLHITYDEYRTSTITDETTVNVQLYVDYFESGEKILSTFVTFFILTAILSVVIVAIKIYNFM